MRMTSDVGEIDEMNNINNINLENCIKSYERSYIENMIIRLADQRTYSSTSTQSFKNGVLVVTNKVEYNRNLLAEHVIWLGLKHGMFVFGQYVTDKYIFNIDTFQNVDIIYFSDKAYSDLLSDLKEYSFKFVQREYSHINDLVLSENIELIIDVLITGIDDVIFPSDFVWNIKFVKSKGNFIKWLNVLDCDFSCNLFYLSSNGIGIRHDPKLKFRLPGPTDVFTFYRNMTLSKRFYITTDYCITAKQISIIHLHAEELISKGWKMHNHSESTFYMGIYKDVMIEHRETCPICLEDFNKTSLIVNTKCKHSYCNDCFKNSLTMIRNFNNCPECSMCRSKYSLKLIN